MKADKTTIAVVALAGVGLFMLYRWNNKGATAAAPAFALGNTPMPGGASSGLNLNALLAAVSGLQNRVVDNGTKASAPAPTPAPSGAAWGAAPTPNTAPVNNPAYVNPWVGDLHWSQKPGAPQPTQSNTSPWGLTMPTAGAAPAAQPTDGSAWGAVATAPVSAPALAANAPWYQEDFTGAGA